MCDEMTERFLTDFELMVILAVLRARDDAYGVAIAREIEETGGRPVTHAAGRGAQGEPQQPVQGGVPAR